MRRLLLLMAMGCGSAGGTDAVRAGDAQTTAPTSDQLSPSSSADAASPTVSEPMGPVLQAAIDAPQLEGYWHVAERPERSPLVLVRFPALQGDPKLVKFGKPVDLVAHADVGTRPHLEIQDIAIRPDRADVVLGYPAEGIVASIHLVREAGAWVVAKAEVVEH